MGPSLLEPREVALMLRRALLGFFFRDFFLFECLHYV
jgi:hypothetical protein